jgi:hypothetical protein
MRTIKTISIEELSKEIGKKFTAERIQEFQKATLMGCYKSIPMMAQRSPVDTGLYAQSWDVQHDEQSVTIGNYAPHSVMIEFGTRPFKPPIKPLLAWAKRVLNDGSQPPKYSNEVWALAVGTQKKIAEQGMKPRRIFEKALPDIIKNVQEEMKKL